MADGQDDGLDVVQHPTLGTLKFPKSMPYSERNASIDRLVQQSAPTGNAGTKQHPLVTPQPGEDFADTMRRGVEMGRQVTPQQLETAKQEGIRDVPTVLSVASLPGLATGIGEGVAGGVPGLLKLGRGLLGAGAGAYAGEKVGGDVGGLFGDTGRKIGQGVGALGGGVVGGGLAAGLERRPATALQALRGQRGAITPLPFGIQRAIPESMVPGGGYEPTYGDVFGAREDMYNDLATRHMKQIGSGSSVTSKLGEGNTSEFAAGTRSLVLTPSEASSEDVMQGIAKRRASERGMQFAGGMTPREGRKVPKLPARIADTEYPKPRETIRFGDE